MRMHVLSIGNSFSDDAQSYLYDILQNDGYDDLIVANLLIGGCTLETHCELIRENTQFYNFIVVENNEKHAYKDYSIMSGLEYAEWDYITFQQASALSGKKESYFDKNGKCYFDYMYDFISTSVSNNPKILFHSTWSYEKGFDLDFFRNYNFSQELMEDGIEEVLKTVINTWEKFDGIIPNYNIIKRLREVHGVPVTRDGFHLYWGIGRYAASLGFAKTINPNSSLYSPKKYYVLTEKEKEQAKSVVLEVFK